MMKIKSSRTDAVASAISRIREIMNGGVDVPHLEEAKLVLMDLCAKTELFPRIDFPIPIGDQTERTFLIYEDDGGEYALYVNSGGPGQNSGPHDHGGSWAIIAAIEGEETHHLYIEEGTIEKRDRAELRQVAELTVKPGGLCVHDARRHSLYSCRGQPVVTFTPLREKLPLANGT